MKPTQSQAETLYSQAVIEFATVGVSFAQLIESEMQASRFLERALSLLPRLYAVALALPAYDYSPEEDLLESYVEEITYEHLRTRISELLGEADHFLTAMDDNIQYSDTTLMATISEYLLDVYQQVGNLLGIIRSENEIALPAGIGRLLFYFREYWGNHLLLALAALHRLYSLELLSDDPA